MEMITAEIARRRTDNQLKKVWNKLRLDVMFKIEETSSRGGSIVKYKVGSYYDKMALIYGLKGLGYKVDTTEDHRGEFIVIEW